MDSPPNPNQQPAWLDSSTGHTGGTPGGPPSTGNVFSRDGLLLWHAGSAKLTVGWSAVLIAFWLMGGAWWLGHRPGDSDLPSLALLGLFMAAAGSTFQAGVHLLVCHRHRVLPKTLVLTIAGYRVVPDGFFGSWLIQRRSTELGVKRLAHQRLHEVGAPPLALCCMAGLALVVDWLWADGLAGSSDGLATTNLTERASSLGVVFRSPAEIAAWTWFLQAAWTVLPVPGSQGRTILESCSLLFHDAMPKASSAFKIARRVDLIQSILAIFVVAVGIYLWERESYTFSAPSWPFVIALGILIWIGRRPALVARSAETIDFISERSDRRRRVPRLSLIGKWRVRKAQRAERAEAVDDQQLDNVLEKLHLNGADSLTTGERRLLERVSRRLRNEEK